MSQEDEETLARLREEWNERARSGLGNFFIASHHGWNEEERWRVQARHDAATATLLLPEGFLASSRMLEIGCGVGRLIPEFAPRVKEYVGIDISEAYLEDAARQAATQPNASVHRTDGDGVPAAVEGRFEFILCWAVFIHCPRFVIERNIAAAVERLASGGRFRFQALADPRDPEGYADLPEELLAALPAPALPSSDDAAEQEREVGRVRDEIEERGLAHLVDDRSYKGHEFTHAELRAVLDQAAGERAVQVFRYDPMFFYAEIA